MNQELIKLNNNLGALSNENGKIDIVEKANDSYDFTDILNEENALEIINKDLSHNKDNLKEVNHKIITSEIYNLILYTVEVLLFLFLHNDFPLKLTLLINLLTYIPYKGVILFTYGTRLKKFKKRNKLKDKIQNLLDRKNKKEKELQEMQEKVQYKKYSSLQDMEKTFSYDLTNDINYPEKNYVKVLSLRKK